MKNLGKIFEDNWRKSVPDYAFYYRFRDSGSTFYGGNQNLRFSASNIADCFINDPRTGLHLIEQKNHKGKSIPLSCIIGTRKNDKPTTKERQIVDLYEANKYTGVFSHLVVFFSDVERCFSLPINKLIRFIKEEDRKSIPIEYFEENGEEIRVEKLRTNYRFDIDKWLNRH